MVPVPLLRSLGPRVIDSTGASLPMGPPITGPNRIIGLYFAAEWGQDCKATTELFLALYKHLRDTHPFEVIFISSDKDSDSFKKHYDGKPWLAMPFEESRKRIRLRRLHRVAHLPVLVLLDGATGRTISRVSRDLLLRDPMGSGFPWRPRSLKEILSEADTVDPKGHPVKFEEYKDSYKGIYFSANWCPPCKAFTPQLISTYEKIKENGHKFEIIFISSDRSEESWRSYHNTMPWPGIHWQEQPLREELVEKLEVKGIPTLIILDKEFNVISREGRSLVNSDPQAKEFPWSCQSVELLRDFHMATILERPCLILFTDEDPNELQFGMEVLLPAAEDYLANVDEQCLPLAFFVAGEDDAADRLRDVASLEEDVVPLLTILDLSEGTKHVLEEGVEISNATVYNFVRRYNEDDLIPTAILPYDMPKEDRTQTQNSEKW